MADVESKLKVTEEVRKPGEPKDETHFVDLHAQLNHFYSFLH